MTRPDCQSEFPETATFYNECFGKMEISCQPCANLNSPESNVRQGCGQDLFRLTPAAPQHPSFHKQRAKFQHYPPTGPAERVLSQSEKIDAERPLVTIVFVQMKGLTPITDNEGAGKSRCPAHQFCEVMIHKFLEEEATIIEEDSSMRLTAAETALLGGKMLWCPSALMEERLHLARGNYSESFGNHGHDENHNPLGL
jgi:hypothetical protein